MNLPLPPGSRIMLVDPPFFRLFGYSRWHYPVTLTVVGSYLRERGYEVCVYDADKPTADCRSLGRGEVRDNYHLYKEALADDDHPVWAEIMEAIRRFQPDAIGLTATTAQSPSAAVVARKTKQLFGRSVKVFLGGSHVDGMLHHDPSFPFGDCYDFVVPKEATTFAAIFDRKPQRRLIAGLDQYAPNNLASLLTSVGCPNRCTFCYHSLDRCFVYRDPDNIRAELEEILAIAGDVSKVMILDHCLFSNPNHYRAVTAILKDVGLPFTAGSRVMALTPEKIAAFLECGGTKLNIGIESGSQGILDRVEKRLSIDDIVQRTQWINDAGIPWMAYIIVGFPFETVDDLKLTEELIYRINPTFVSINRFTPYPGTVIYEELFKDAKFDFTDLFQLDSSGCLASDDAVEQYIDHLYQTFDQYNLARSAD